MMSVNVPKEPRQDTPSDVNTVDTSHLAVSDKDILHLKFKMLVKQWRIERGVTSSTTKMVLCSAYQQIIGMGKPAIPLILQELAAEEEDPDHWFWALTSITGQQPLNDEDRGDNVRMAEKWLNWGRRNGYGF